MTTELSTANKNAETRARAATARKMTETLTKQGVSPKQIKDSLDALGINLDPDLKIDMTVMVPMQISMPLVSDESVGLTSEEQSALIQEKLAEIISGIIEKHEGLETLEVVSEVPMTTVSATVVSHDWKDEKEVVSMTPPANHVLAYSGYEGRVAHLIRKEYAHTTTTPAGGVAPPGGYSRCGTSSYDWREDSPRSENRICARCAKAAT